MKAKTREVANKKTYQIARRRRQPRREIRITDDLDPVARRDDLIRPSLLGVAAIGRGQIDHDAAGLHDVQHVLIDQDGRLPTGDQRRGDDDVDVAGLLQHEAGLGRLELVGHLLGVSAGAGAVLLDVDLEESGAHGLHLLFTNGSNVEGADDGAHVLGGLDGGEAGDASAEDQNLGRRDLTRRRHLPGEEAGKLLGRLHHGPISGNIGLAAQDVVGLGPRQHPGDAVQGEDVGVLVGQGIVQLGVDGRGDHPDQRLAGELLQFAVGHIGRADLGNDVGLGDDLLRAGEDDGPGLGVGGIAEAGLFSGCGQSFL